MADPQSPNSSLQKTSPSPLPEKASDQPLSARETVSAPEVSYFRRCVEYSLNKTREYEKLELTAATVFMIIVAVSQGTGEGVLAALIAFLFVLFGISLVHFLRAPRALDERHRNQLALARLLLEKVKGETEQPDIQCEIKDIHEESPSSVEGFDYIFTMSVYLKNKGKVTGVRGYKLRMIQGEHIYPAEKVSLQGYYLERQEPHTSTSARAFGGIELKNVSYPMADLDDIKNAPLDNVGRDGWLRFVIRGVWWNDEYEKELGDDMTADEIKLHKLPKRLELTIIDSEGAEYKFEKPEPFTATGRIRRYANAR